MDSFTFRSCCGRFEFSVKKEFIDKNPDYQSCTAYVLNAERKMYKWLHNESGPATTDLATGNMHYYVNGKQIKEQEIHRIQFHERLDDIINGND